MTPVTDRSFGLLIAYVIPGSSVIWLWGQQIPSVAGWLAADHSTAPSVGGFLYVTVASIAVGLLLSTLRWAILDWVHHLTGVLPPRSSYSSDPASLEAYRLVVDLHYRYYQFYGSSLLVLMMLILLPPGGPVELVVTTTVARLALVAAIALFFAASRDTLAKCYSRGSSVYETTTFSHERTDAMTNGGHYGHVVPPSPAKRQASDASETAPTANERENVTADEPYRSALRSPVETTNRQAENDSASSS